MSKNKYIIASNFITIVLCFLLILFSIYVKKIHKSHVDFNKISFLFLSNYDNTNNFNIISDTLFFGQSIMKEFYENKIDTNCKNVFFKNSNPNKTELNNFIFFLFATINEFPYTFCDYSIDKNTTKFSIILSCSEDITITFETLKTNKTTLIKNIKGIGRLINKVCPIIIE